MARDHVQSGRLGYFGKFCIAQNGHGVHALGQCDPLFGVIQLTIFTQNQPMFGGILDHLRCPCHAATGIITTKDSHDHTIIGSDIFKATKNVSWDIDDIAFFQRNLTCITPTSPKEAPAPFEDKEHLSSGVTV